LDTTQQFQSRAASRNLVSITLPRLGRLPSGEASPRRNAWKTIRGFAAGLGRGFMELLDIAGSIWRLNVAAAKPQDFILFNGEA
jgi:hypothetical protein